MPDYLPFTNSQGSVGTEFANFTTKLVTEVMEAIVDSSIKQLEAYGDMVKNVAGSVADYQKEVAGIDMTRAADDPVNVPSIDAFAQQVLGLTFDLASGGNVTLDPEDQGHVATQLAGATRDDNGTAVAVETEVVDADGNDKTITVAALGDYILDHLGKKSNQEYELLKFIITAGLQKVVITDGHILTKVNMTFDASQSSAKNTGTLDTQAKGWSWNAHLFGRYGGSKGFIGGAASGGMYDNSVRIATVNTSDLSSTRLSASMFGEVKIGFATESFPPAGLGG